MVRIMAKVKIVTDSTSDLPKGVAAQLGITVVPLYIHFGEEVFKDGVDISSDYFYRRLTEGPILPKTSAPSPDTFKQLYNGLALHMNLRCWVAKVSIARYRLWTHAPRRWGLAYSLL